MRVSRTRVLLCVAALSALGTAGAAVKIVSATSPTGTVVATPLVRATVGDDIKIIGDGNRIELRTKEATDVVLVHNVAQAGWTSGWHMHTGPVFISVVSGTATLYDGTCGGRVFTNGQAFVEPPMTPVNVKNETGARLEWYTTQLIPAGGATRLNIRSPC